MRGRERQGREGQGRPGWEKERARPCGVGWVSGGLPVGCRQAAAEAAVLARVAQSHGARLGLLDEEEGVPMADVKGAVPKAGERQRPLAEGGAGDCCHHEVQPPRRPQRGEEAQVYQRPHCRAEPVSGELLLGEIPAGRTVRALVVVGGGSAAVRHAAVAPLRGLCRRPTPPQLDRGRHTSHC